VDSHTRCNIPDVNEHLEKAIETVRRDLSNGEGASAELVQAGVGSGTGIESCCVMPIADSDQTLADSAFIVKKSILG